MFLWFLCVAWSGLELISFFPICWRTVRGMIIIPGPGERLEPPFFLSVLCEGPVAKLLEQVSVILFLPTPTSWLGAAKTWLCMHITWVLMKMLFDHRPSSCSPFSVSQKSHHPCLKHMPFRIKNCQTLICLVRAFSLQDRKSKLSLSTPQPRTKAASRYDPT